MRELLLALFLALCPLRGCPAVAAPVERKVAVEGAFFASEALGQVVLRSPDGTLLVGRLGGKTYGIVVGWHSPGVVDIERR